MSSVQFTIGTISLNIATLLYFCSYWPQLRHNQKLSHLTELSLNYHFLLLTGDLSDLIYAISMGMPLQYQFVSMVSVGCLLYQHCQLWRLYFRNLQFQVATLILITILVSSVYITFFHSLSTSHYLMIAYLSQACYIIYLVPQVVQNQLLRSAQSLSVLLLIFEWCCCLCDNVSAWFLVWPMPNKIGSIIQIMLVMILMLQWYYFQYGAKFANENAFSLPSS